MGDAKLNWDIENDNNTRGCNLHSNVSTRVHVIGNCKHMKIDDNTGKT